MEWIGDLERAFAAAIYPNRVLVGVLLLGAVVGIAWLAARRRWDLAVRRNPRRSAAILVPALAIALPLGWYLGSPLVLSSTLDEPAPVVAGRPTAVPSSTPAPPTRSPGDPSPTPLIRPSPSRILLERAGKFRGADDFHFGRGTA